MRRFVVNMYEQDGGDREWIETMLGFGWTVVLRPFVPRSRSLLEAGYFRGLESPKSSDKEEGLA